MKYISSDTNVWIDFNKINKLNLPFKLPYAYLISASAAEEIIRPAYLKGELFSLGLMAIKPEKEENDLAERLRRKYSKLSYNDSLALSIAKKRNITLLTGDKALRKAAEKEGVKITGTIGIIDQLLEQGFIDSEEACECFQSLLKLNGDKVRLPRKVLEQRIKELQKPKTFTIQLPQSRRLDIVRRY